MCDVTGRVCGGTCGSAPGVLKEKKKREEEKEALQSSAPPATLPPSQGTFSWRRATRATTHPTRDITHALRLHPQLICLRVRVHLSVMGAYGHFQNQTGQVSLPTFLAPCTVCGWRCWRGSGGVEWAVLVAPGSHGVSCGFWS